MTRVHNFSAGPAALPISVLETAAAEMLDYGGSGMSIMEQSHRGKVYQAVHDEALELVRRLLRVPSTHDILLLTGGATQQFAQVPMNLRKDGQSADYVVTGVWGKKALKEAKQTGIARAAASTEEPDGKFLRVPGPSEYSFDPNAAYVHLTTNNTVMGTQFRELPDTGNVPLVVDMSSDVLGRPIDVSKLGVLYAGAQKNLGPSGVTVVILRRDLVDEARRDVPFFFQYRTHRDENSLSNTAPTFSIYMLRGTLRWLEERGGMEWAYAENQKKANRLYSVLESRPDVYRLTVEKESRSLMNVVWNLPTPEADTRCVEAATKAGLIGLKGHRIVGGMRASIYNAVPYESVEALARFLEAYQP